MTKPLTREERESWCSRDYDLAVDDLRRYEATVQAVEAERDALKRVLDQLVASAEKAGLEVVAKMEIDYGDSTLRAQIKRAPE